MRIRNKYIFTVTLFLLFLSGCISLPTGFGGGQITIVAVGDISHPAGYSFSGQSYSLGAAKYRYVKQYIGDADFAFANLEAPFTDKPAVLQKEFPFSSPPRELDYIVDAGFNLFSLANNHTADAGYQGISDTLDNLARVKRKNGGLVWAGAGRTPAEASRPRMAKTKTGRKIVFFSYGNNASPYVNTFEPARAKDDVRRMRARYPDAVIIVSIHSGVEYTHYPPGSIVSSYRSLVDSGATVILGHHPHVLQGVEQYNSGIIFYSLGNFCFTSMTARHKANNAKLYSMIARLTLVPRGKGLEVRMKIVPLYVDNGNPMFAGGKRLDPRPFQPFVPGRPFSDEILKSIELWSKALPGNKLRFTRGNGYMTAVCSIGN